LPQIDPIDERAQIVFRARLNPVALAHQPGNGLSLRLVEFDLQT
jgi:hypothetical protein